MDFLLILSMILFSNALYFLYQKYFWLRSSSHVISDFRTVNVMAFTVAIKRGIAVEAVYVASYEIVSSFT